MAEDQENSQPSGDAPGTPDAASGPPDTARPAAILPLDTDFDLLRDYVTECREHIEAAETALLTLEATPGDREAVHSIFRAFHTIKSASGFLGLDWVREFAHYGESLLARVRDGEIHLTGGQADLALQACDALRTMTQSLNALKGGDPAPIPSDYVTLLDALRQPDRPSVTEATATLAPRVGDLLVATGRATREALEAAAARDQGTPIGEMLVRAGAATAVDVARALRMQREIEGGLSEETVRVTTERLDRLVSIVGELVIVQSLVIADPALTAHRRDRLARNLAQAGKLARELQDLTMGLRMVPLRGTFQRMARLTRDLGRRFQVPVRLVIEGADTEIDRRMVEALCDPLTHMIRNAVDHGIEPVAQRLRAGKPETGTLRLRAYHAGDNVVIELSDDGRGLDRERIRAGAVNHGLIESTTPLTDGEILALIFEPGLSTAEQVTDVSGRGVGMDVVRRSVESLKGRVDVASAPGRGTTFTLRLPLTLALSDALVVRVGSERFLLPAHHVERCFRPAPKDVTSISGLGDVVRVQEDWIPILQLHELFALHGAHSESGGPLLIAIRAHGRRAALTADEIIGQQQTVIRSLGHAIADVPGIGGAAILGDGRVGLVLDVHALLEMAGSECDDAAASSARPLSA
jgi:two-component system chemotaxis sensor kinase CheA